MPLFFFTSSLTVSDFCLDLRDFQFEGANMTNDNRRVLGVAVVLLVMAISAQAQWVMVARAVSGRVQQMRQQGSNGNGGYDVATVVLEANADKVYQTALQRLQAHSAEVKIVKQDAKKRMVEFGNGTQDVGLQATPLGDKLTQLVVASSYAATQPSATSIVVKSILDVCTEMKVECTLQND